MSAGERVPFVLTYKPSHEPRPKAVEAEQALRDTEWFWSDWMRDYDYEGRWDEAVRRSLITLKALTYAPTGGRIVAAATTSLPEQLGGPRNWDYRFCWLRDATFTLQALLGTGFDAEAKAWREWLLRAVVSDPADLQIMYGIDGTRRLTEFTLDWLSGYEGSTPVRVGNAASDQFQLDTWGEVLDGLHLARTADIDADENAWDMQLALMDFLEGHWSDPDNSLWEVRGDRRHFVHSKVLAWAGVDRMVQGVERHGLDGPVDKWKALREQIHGDVCANGFDAERGTFTQFYGSRGWTRRCCSSRRSGSCRGTTRGWSAPSTRCSASCTGTGSCSATTRAPTAAWTACRATRARSWPARSGSRTRCTASAAPSRRPSCSSGCSACATTWGCSARSTTRLPGGRSGTPRRRTRTSGSSTPRGTWAAPVPPSAGPEH